WVLLLIAIMWGMVASSITLLEADGQEYLYLPYIVSPPLPPLPELLNPSFENGWTDMPPAPAQQPNDWTLSWVEPGGTLYDSNDTATAIPECVHKLSEDLPPDEQLGGPNALILDGDTTYKCFQFYESFGAELRQTITGLEPNRDWILVVPIQVHLHGDTYEYSAESGVWVNGVGSWANGGLMGDRQWYEHHIPFTVRGDGSIEIVIRFKSKYPYPKDFFIDALRVERP
ncbi:MAG: hypothetical protein KC415_15755, partial [Anaerolineales bacterium]|nr:hypothetical protein [Anaerolineales bacterium]